VLDFQKLSAQYQQALLRQVVPFWLKNSRDERCGGYFDILTAVGEAIDTDKSVPLQAQQSWAFAWLYNTLDGQSAWLEHARHGASFLSHFAHDDTLVCYTQLDRRGRALLPSQGSIPDSFVVMAYAQLHRATGDDEWSMLAQQTFSGMLRRRAAAHTEQTQSIGGFRQLRHLSEPVAVLKATQEMQPFLDEVTWKETTEAILHELLWEFLDRRSDTLRESVLPEGAFLNTPEGRRLNTGLTFQVAGYLLDLCAELGNRKLAMQVVTWCLRLCEQAWDESAGGLNQFVDIKKLPSVCSDWRQKWAWVQVEAISALLKGYSYTHHPDCPKWFKRIHDYTFQYFPDTKQTGWYIALDQHYQPIIDVKSTSVVGCFSLIRCLAESAQLLTKCGQIQPLGRNIRADV
jgi:N-acylglucosamine 2-epimerase